MPAVGSDELLATAVAVLRSHPYGFLGTAGVDGPSQRLVQHLRVDDDATVWVGTSPRSRKVAEVGRTAGASYAVEDRDTVAYATVIGTAEVVDDLTTRRALWEEGLRAFFPAGPDGDDFVLLALRPSAVELMSFGAGIHPDPYGLVPARIERRDGSWSTTRA